MIFGHPGCDSFYLVSNGLFYLDLVFEKKRISGKVVRKLRL